MVKLSQPQVKALCVSYKAGESVSALSREFDVARVTVRNILIREGVRAQNPQRTTSTYDAEVIRRYGSGESITSIAAALGIGRNKVAQTLWRGDLTRSNTEHLRKYSCNEQIFQTIDSEHPAYWLGFIAADGCIVSDRILRIALARKDRDQLERFKDSIDGNHRIYEYEGKECFDGYMSSGTAILIVHSKEMCDDLARHGIKPRKTATLEWPSDLPDEMLWHYLRGYFDGDGWVCFRRTPRRLACQVGFVGTESWLVECRAFLKRTLDFPEARLYWPGYDVRVGRLTYGGSRRSAAFANALYAGATVWMPRKRERFESIIEHLS